MTADDLRDAEAQYRMSAADAVRTRGVRDDMIRAALHEGWTHAQVAEATGLTRGRIGQIGSRS